MNFEGKARITSIKEVSKKFSTASLYLTTKKDDEYITAFMSVGIVGKALESIKRDRIQNKDKVNVKGFLKADGYNGVNSIVGVVQEIELERE